MKARYLGKEKIGKKLMRPASKMNVPIEQTKTIEITTLTG